MERIQLANIEMNPFNAIGEDNFLLTAGDEHSFNSMTAGWGGLGYVWNKPVAFVFVREARYTFSLIEKSDMFSLSFFSKEYKKDLAFLGTHSGRDVNKVASTSLSPIALDGTVGYKEASLIFTCRKLSRSYIGKDMLLDPTLSTHYPQNDYHYMYIGEIKGAYID